MNENTCLLECTTWDQLADRVIAGCSGAAGYSLLEPAARCWLSAVCCLLSAVCWLHAAGDSSSLLAAGCWLASVWCLVSAVGCLLTAVCWLLAGWLAAGWPLSAVCCLLSTAHCLLAPGWLTCLHTCTPTCHKGEFKLLLLLIACCGLLIGLLQL